MAEKENTKQSLGHLIEKYKGYNGLRRKMLNSGDTIGIERMRLELCEAAYELWEGKTSYNTILMEGVMALVFPDSHNSSIGATCGPCAEAAYNRIKNERKNITARIAKLEEKAANAPKLDSVVEVVQVSAVQEPVAIPLQQGQPVYVADGGNGKASVRVGMLVQRMPVVLVSMLDDIGSDPIEFPQNQVFIGLQHAYSKAMAMKDVAVDVAEIEEPELRTTVEEPPAINAKANASDGG